jgi:hypothetical protein
MEGRAVAQPTYYTNCFGKGPVKYLDVPGSIGVLESPDNHMPIGIANCRTHYENGVAIWESPMRGAKLPGKWIIIDREFRVAESP